MPDVISYADFKSTQFQILYRKSMRFSMQYENIYHAPPLGKELSSFCLVLKSNVTFTTEDGIVTAEPGDFLYMPDSVQYSSRWIGSPDIEFISSFFRLTGTKQLDDLFSNDVLKRLSRPIDQQIAFQNIKELGGFRMQKQMETLQMLNRKNPQELLQSLAVLYDIFSQVYPYLKMRKTKKHPEALEPALVHIDANFTLNEPISTYAQMCHMSESHFYHLFQQHLKATPIEYRNTLRIRQAAKLLLETNQSIEQISSMMGFESAIYFRRVFKALYGSTPSHFRKNA